ncbi:MAG: TolC family protein [Deltaproteobacteria bacterium]
MIASRKIFGSLVCLLMCAMAVSARAGGAPEPGSYGYFDFPTCVRYALVHSDEFLRNRLDIQIRSADLKDAHSELLPTVEVATRFYVARAGNEFGDNPLNVELRLKRDYNPALALFKIKSQGIMVDIGRITHFSKISQGIAHIAKAFYAIDVLKRQIRARKQMLALRREKVVYGKSRIDQGAVDPLQVRLWSNAVRGERIQLRTLEDKLETKTAELKVLMGYHPDYYLPLDTRDAANQILDGFNGRLITFADIQGSNFSLKILAKKEQLQSTKVAGAYVTLLPQPTVLMESLSGEQDRRSGFNFAVGLNYVLWDGFARVRDIKRQKMIARQTKIDRRQRSRDLYNFFRKLTSLLDLSGEREGFQREQAKLSELSEERSLLRYKSGDIPYEVYLESRISRVDANLAAMGMREARVDALIDLATLAGGLNRYNARIRF